MVLSTATQTASTLNIVASPGSAAKVRTILLEADLINPAKLDVKDGSTLLGQFTIASITNMNVQVAGNDAIKIDDSNGFPFAPGTGFNPFGSGANNALFFVGSRSISGGELLDAGLSSSNGSLQLGGATFVLPPVIASITDDITDTGSLTVQSHAASVSLAGPNGITETLNGLAQPGGGGNKLTFRGKANVELQIRTDNAITKLNASQAALGLQSFTVDQFGTNDTLNINAAPSFAGTPFGGTYVDDPGTQDQVNLAANSGPVHIFGNSTTKVVLRTDPGDFSKSVTSGINGPVSVANAGELDIADGGNVKTNENIKVTESTVSGTGLFGAGGFLQYSSLIPGDLVPSIFTGQLDNTYTVKTSSPTASFNSQGLAILISDASTTGSLNVQVDLDANSDLSLSVLSNDPARSSLFISAPPGSGFSPFIMPKPEGFEQVFVPGAFHSSGVFYNGFDTAGHS
jgi:hypothetical protein